jgi:Na+-driven multidrug efflux pump
MPGIEAMKVYFFGFVFMSFQFSGQSTFQALGDARHSIFFSLLRKAFIVVPLTLLLPRVGFGVLGVFMAEPISNVFCQINWPLFSPLFKYSADI